MNSDNEDYPFYTGAAYKAAFEPILANTSLMGTSIGRVALGVRTFAIGKAYAGCIGETFRTVASLAAIKPITVAEPIKLASYAFQSVFQRQEELRKSFLYDKEQWEIQENTENKLIVPDKEIVIAKKEIIIPQRKRGNRTGSVPNYDARNATKKYFYDFIKANEKILMDFTRKQIMFFIQENMLNEGLKLETYFHWSYFHELYAKCPDVNHKSGNHHGQKDRPEIIALVKKAK